MKKKIRKTNKRLRSEHYSEMNKAFQRMAEAAIDLEAEFARMAMEAQFNSYFIEVAFDEKKDKESIQSSA